MMRDLRHQSRATACVVVLASVWLAGCRQPDGTVPQPTGEAANKTSDISRDLLAVARQDKTAAADLKSDLENLTGDAPPGYLIEDLSAGLVSALGGATLRDEAAQKLAHQLYVAVCARDLSERQIELLRKDLTGTLVSAGVDPPKAEPVAATAADIQRAMTGNKRRWWQRG